MIKRPDFQNFWYRHNFANKSSHSDLSQPNNSLDIESVFGSDHSSLGSPIEPNNCMGLTASFDSADNSSLIL